MEDVTSPVPWYTPLTRVTQLSKYLAMALFVMLPLVGFWMGVEYGKRHIESSAPNGSVKLCEESGLSDEAIEAATDAAMAGLEDPWGADFWTLATRVETRLGCTLQRSTDTLDVRASEEDVDIMTKFQVGEYVDIVVTIDTWEAETGGGETTFYTVVMSPLKEGASDMPFRLGGLGDEAVACIDKELWYEEGATARLRGVIRGNSGYWYGMGCSVSGTSLTKN